MDNGGSIHGTPSIDLRIPKDCKLKYVWIAEFKNGSLLGQYDREGREILYRDVQKRLNDVRKLHFTAVDSDHRVTVEITEDMRPICFRRHRHKMNVEDNDFHTPGHEIIYSLGFQKTIRGHNIKAIMYLDVMGNVVLSDR